MAERSIPTRFCDHPECGESEYIDPEYKFELPRGWFQLKVEYGTGGGNAQVKKVLACKADHIQGAVTTMVDEVVSQW